MIKTQYILGIILSLLALFLFTFNYLIAEYLAAWDVDADKNLAIRFNEYAVIMCLSFIITKLKKNRWTEFILNIGIGVCISDVLDRFVFDITSFQFNDITMYLLTITTSYYQCLKKKYKP